MAVTPPKGFIAVLLIVTLGALLALTTLAAVRSTVGRTALEIDTLASERALAAAESCGDEALVRLAFNPSYGGNETITIAAGTCTIEGVTSLPSGNRVVPMFGTVDATTRRLWLEFALNPLRVISVKEAP